MNRGECFEPGCRAIGVAWVKRPGTTRGWYCKEHSDVACADVADSNDPRVLIKVAHQHWYGIGWPEDAKPVALLERAMALLDGSVSGADAVCMEAVGTPGVRDPANRCDMFSPGKPTNGGCQGDGHYLCAGCMLLEVPR